MGEDICDKLISYYYKVLLINYSNIGLIQDFLPKQFDNANSANIEKSQSILKQGGHGLWKTGKTWKMMKKNSLCGKIREFDKNKKIREKSGNVTSAAKKLTILVVSFS